MDDSRVSLTFNGVQGNLSSDVSDPYRILRKTRATNSDDTACTVGILSLACVWKSPALSNANTSMLDHGYCSFFRYTSPHKTQRDRMNLSRRELLSWSLVRMVKVFGFADC